MSATTSVLCVAGGAALGGVCRWLVSVALNGLFPAIPPGTLAVNMIGGYLIGLSMAAFAMWPDCGGTARLFLISGFLGALTTFSAFSGEVCQLILQERFGMALAAVALHVGGALGMTFLGMTTFAIMHKFFG